ncbi:hypothetical protein DEO72_LG3g1697 [Vigna unguiculata]|uniref:Uncharacterized protein n=1 Tax=Vigna unguiculata TaxID=3917 RepID=A0A4D6LFB1_VIGUN|nr:hypothetical protein DEO72_LG3g1697 [Vigna unguiculata]
MHVNHSERATSPSSTLASFLGNPSSLHQVSRHSRRNRHAPSTLHKFTATLAGAIATAPEPHATATPATIHVPALATVTPPSSLYSSRSTSPGAAAVHSSPSTGPPLTRVTNAHCLHLHRNHCSQLQSFIHHGITISIAH